MVKKITAIGKLGEDGNTVIARTATHPTTQAAISVQKFNKSFGELDLLSLIEALKQANGQERGEDMLTAQAHVLDAIFNSLAQRAAANMGEGYLQATETYLKLALRAQSQSRATWETLSAVKNPPMVGYARQANFAQNQQVNNGVPSRARETDIGQSKQSGADSELLPDTRASETESGVDTPLETVGEIDRTKVGRG
jgi:hypothetical protein